MRMSFVNQSLLPGVSYHLHFKQGVTAHALKTWAQVERRATKLWKFTDGQLMVMENTRAQEQGEVCFCFKKKSEETLLPPDKNPTKTQQNKQLRNRIRQLPGEVASLRYAVWGWVPETGNCLETQSSYKRIRYEN